MRALTTMMVAALLLAAVAAPAAAHVTAHPDRAESPFVKTDIRVGHGCDGSPTTAVRVRIPEGVESATPQVVPGWDIELTRDAAGEQEAEEAGRITEVAWVGGPLPDEHLQEFGVRLHIGEDAPEVVWLPTVQECEEGEHRWVGIPDSLDEWDQLEAPAPYVEAAFLRDDVDGAADSADLDDAAAATAEDDAGAAEDDAGGEELTVVALGAGLLGALLGAVALGVALRR